MLAGSVVIFAFVMVLLVAAFHRRLPGRARQGVWLVGLGLVFPGIVLAALLVWGLLLGERHLVPGQPGATVVQAEARQWLWTFRYPGTGRAGTVDTLHIPAGRPVEVHITTLDVVHSFWVPRLAGKLDAVPGHVNRLVIQADRPGDYAGISAEFSGAGYLGHRFTLRAHDADGWAAFLSGETGEVRP
jgi:heme/copper-type cytochrome/quinol oxidase subunit 2